MLRFFLYLPSYRLTVLAALSLSLILCVLLYRVIQNSSNIYRLMGFSQFNIKVL